MLIIQAVILDRYDFIEEPCILRCHLDSHLEGFSGVRRSFVIRGCRAATSGAYVHNHEGTVPCVFNLYGCLFYFRFVECTKVYFCLSDFCGSFWYVFVWGVFSGNLLQIKVFDCCIVTGLPKTATLLFLSSKNVWKVISAGNLFNLFNRSSKSIQMGRSKPSRFSK